MNRVGRWERLGAEGLSYSDAVKALGGSDSKIVAALDRLAGGLLLGVTGDGGQFVLNLFDAKGELARLSGELVQGLGTRLRGLGRFDRSERLAAAHKIIILTAYFETLAKVEWPFSSREMRLSRSGQVWLATARRFLLIAFGFSLAFCMTAICRAIRACRSFIWM